MDRRNSQVYGTNDFQQQGKAHNPNDAMDGLDLVSPTGIQNYGQQSQIVSENDGQMQDRRSSSNTGMINPRQSTSNVDPRMQNMAQLGNPIMGGLNSHQFTQAASMGYNPLMGTPSVFPAQQYPNAQLMSQMLINNAANLTYANMLANAQSMQPQMQPRYPQNAQMLSQMSQAFMPNGAQGLDPSDLNIQAMMRNGVPAMGMSPNFQGQHAGTSSHFRDPQSGFDPGQISTSDQASNMDQRRFSDTKQGHSRETIPGAQEPAGLQHISDSHSRRNSTSNVRRGDLSEAEQRTEALRRYSMQQVQHAQSRMPSTMKTEAGADISKQGSVVEHDSGQPRPPQHYPPSVKIDQSSYKDAYSSTGFDMLSVLMRVATRKNPEIDIGAVDLSCAFVVTDVKQHDIPIVYVSENFERLTGYTKHEILGQNCRFLQSPHGHVQGGVKRKYADDDTILHLKNTINAMKEAQVSVINYRKGGQPFMNLLTVIPVCFADSAEIQFYVGFQVDLVEQPHSVTKKNPDGTYTINYQRGLTMPRYIFTGKGAIVPSANAGQTISREEVSTVLSTIDSGNSQLSQRVWDKVLLENTDDVIFVLSLKGLFLYLSPASSRILEYGCDELVGTSLSSVCHPSDIVPVTRELKDATNDVTVTVVFRIRRKTNGYTWFEGHGSVYTEQGKGRKSIVLVGRERPVYTLKKRDIIANGGFGENEVWTKLSTSGMILYVSSSIRSLLDNHPDELIGTSIQTLMRPDSRADFCRILELGRSGRRASTRHELLNKRGQVLQAISTVHPGDATEGSKPTFLIGQSRLLKYTRPSSNNQTQRGTISSGMAETALPIFDNASLTTSPDRHHQEFETLSTHAGQDSLPLGDQSAALAHELNLFDELKTTRSTSWQFELRQMEKRNRLLAEELQGLLAARKKRKRRKGAGAAEKECSNCRTKQTPEWRRGPTGRRDLCNSCGLRWAKQQGRISPRTSSHRSTKSTQSDATNVSSGRQAGEGGAGAGAGISASAVPSAGSDAMSAEEPSTGKDTKDGLAGSTGSEAKVMKAAKIESADFAAQPRAGSVTTKFEPTS